MNECKAKKDSRTLKFNKWMGGVSSVLTGVMAISDSFGYMKMDWTCISLWVAVIGICGYNYWLRLHTSQAVE
jgi:hypothetical protein